MPIVTWTVITINVLIFVYELALPPAELERLAYLCGIVPARYTHPEWAQSRGLPLDYWPFFTGMFLHGGWNHIIGNMWMLWIFGDNVEDAMGPLRFAIFYVITGLLAGATHVVLNPDATIPAVGASGAIAGVLGAYFALYPRARIIAVFPLFFWPLFFELPAFSYLFVWFLSQMFGGAVSAIGPQDVGGIAFWAHVGGFVGGVLLHRAFLLPTRLRQRPFHPDEYGVEAAWA